MYTVIINFISTVCGNDYTIMGRYYGVLTDGRFDTVTPDKSIAKPVYDIRYTAAHEPDKQLYLILSGPYFHDNIILCITTVW